MYIYIICVCMYKQKSVYFTHHETLTYTHTCTNAYTQASIDLQIAVQGSAHIPPSPTYLRAQRLKTHSFSIGSESAKDLHIRMKAEAKLDHANACARDRSRSSHETDRLGQKSETDRLGQKPETDRLGQKSETDRLGQKPETDRLGQKPETDRLGQKLGGVDDMVSRVSQGKKKSLSLDCSEETLSTKDYTNTNTNTNTNTYSCDQAPAARAHSESASPSHCSPKARGKHQETTEFLNCATVLEADGHVSEVKLQSGKPSFKSDGVAVKASSIDVCGSPPKLAKLIAPDKTAAVNGVASPTKLRTNAVPKLNMEMVNKSKSGAATPRGKGADSARKLTGRTSARGRAAGKQMGVSTRVSEGVAILSLTAFAVGGVLLMVGKSLWSMVKRIFE